MKHLLFVATLLFSLTGFTQVGVYPNEENLRSDTIDVLDYAIHLDLSDYQNKELKGYTQVTCTPLMNNVSVLNLDLLLFSIDSISLNNNPLTYTYNDTLLSIDLGQNFIPGDTLQVEVHYHGSTRKDPSGWGGVYFGNNYIFNLGVGFEDNPHNVGRYWFPCFDNFKERSTYNLYLSTLNSQFATSMGELISSSPNGPDLTEYHWKLDETIPTYLAMFAVNNYVTVNDTYNGINGSTPIALYAKSGDTTKLKNSFSNLVNAMDAFENLYGPYQFNKIGYTVVPFNMGAMEHASNISYPDSDVDGTTDSETLMAHELAHQWWGNYATCLTPQDMWLNEGMASFSANYFLEYTYGWETAKPAVKQTLFNIVRKAHIDEGGYLAISGVPHNLTYGDHVYRKGSLVAQNLRMLVGAENFGPLVTGFLQTRAYNNMTSLQFRDYLQANSSADVDGFFDGWVFNGGFPDYAIDSVVITPTPGLTDVAVTVSQKLNHAPNPFSEIPLEIGFYNENYQLYVDTILAGENQETYTFNLPFSPVMVSLNPNNALCYSTTDDLVVVKSTGSYNMKNGMMDLTVQSVTDSAIIKVEHHWSAPDGVKDWDTKPYRLSNYRYWKVDGDFPDGFKVSSQFLYDGRAAGGYLDSLLVKITEDSLVLLYRKDAHHDWNEYSDYTKNTLGSSTNQFGLIQISNLIAGEYTLANIDHTVLSTGTIENLEKEINIFPNPSNGNITVDWGMDLIPQKVDIYSTNGVLIQSHKPVQKQTSFSISNIPSGNYLASITLQEGVISKTFIVLIP